MITKRFKDVQIGDWIGPNVWGQVIEINEIQCGGGFMGSKPFTKILLTFKRATGQILDRPGMPEAEIEVSDRDLTPVEKKPVITKNQLESWKAELANFPKYDQNYMYADRFTYQDKESERLHERKCWLIQKINQVESNQEVAA